MYDNSDDFHYESSLVEKLNGYFRDVYMANRVVQTSLVLSGISRIKFISSWLSKLKKS
jgi:hypothetical protein